MQKITNKTKLRSWILLGMLMSAVLIGVNGCGAKDTTAGSTPASQQSNDSSPENQGQAAQRRTLNPAVEAAMSIRRLEANEQMALTSDQKDVIKPILQSLIDTTDPEESFLQEKADAITAVFTEEQKTYLSTNTPPSKPNSNGENEKGQLKGQPDTQSNGQSGAPNKQSGTPSQPQDIFKQVLDSLT